LLGKVFFAQEALENWKHMGSDWADLFLSPRFDRSAHYVLAHYVCANHHGANMSIVH